MKIYKTVQVYIVQGHYGQGWEDLTECDSYKEARDDLKAYRDNDPAPTRLITRRIPNPDYTTPITTETR
jgi:hypothetical protein